MQQSQNKNDCCFSGLEGAATDGFYDSELFSGISREEYDRMMDCFRPVLRRFKAGETVCDYQIFSDNIGIVQDGEVRTIRIDEEGNRTILEDAGKGGIFGRIISFQPPGDDAIMVVCKKDCSVLFIEYRHIVRRCENACRHHSVLVENLLRLMSERAVELSMRIEILSRRSIRGKLLAYFRAQAQRRKAKTCQIGFSYSDLADFLCVDRCAMMRELKKMRDENLVHIDGKTFTLTD